MTKKVNKSRRDKSAAANQLHPNNPFEKYRLEIETRDRQEIELSRGYADEFEQLIDAAVDTL